MINYFYTYVLLSEKDNKLYYGYTKNLKLRIEQHNNGEVRSTKYRRPLKLIYFEGCLNKNDALKREKYFKTYYGSMFIDKRLNKYFKSLNSYSIGQVNNNQ
ncbi:MAG: GIY-YIG nuclease family protein [Candidatus Marinimicrobia bacterium]|nr:GIY-YIG nuclease family protein [Candidatus Neomarinimicrobiota bacterium]